MRFGGPPKAAQELCRELVRQGEEVTIYTTDLDGRERMAVPRDQPILDEDGVERWYFSTQRTGLYGVSVPLVNTIRKNIANFDVVHIHSLYRFTSSVAAHYCRRYGVPYIIRPHGTLDPFIYYRHRLRKIVYERLIENRNLEKAAAVHFTAAEEMTLAQSLGLKFRGVVVPLGIEINPPSSDRDDLRESFACEWPATRGKKVILFFGRITLKKGLDLLAKAFGEIARNRDDVHLFLAGPDDEGYGRKVRTWLKEEGVLDRATFAGMLTGKRKEAALASADIFTLPSYTENFGLAVVEALAAGLASVISNKINIWRELSGANAAIVIRCEAKELVSAISALLDDPERRHLLGEAGKKVVAEQFTWPIVARRMIALYRDIAASNPRNSSLRRSAA
jgi:glycosyltransferase involved in cell wall biosynthesis